MKVLMGPSPYGMIIDAFICIHVCVLFCIFQVFKNNNHVFFRKTIFKKLLIHRCMLLKCISKKNKVLKVRNVISLKLWTILFLVDKLSFSYRMVHLIIMLGHGALYRDSFGLC